MSRVRKSGVLTPALYLVDMGTRRIFMEYLGDEALTLKDFIRGINDLEHPAMAIIADHIAANLAKMHTGDTVHGDLTTSNMMIRPKLRSILPN